MSHIAKKGTVVVDDIDWTMMTLNSLNFCMRVALHEGIVHIIAQS